MNDSDVRELSKVYRKIRKDVYEEATRPLSNDPDMHRQNKEKLRQSIDRICSNADLKKYAGTDKSVAKASWHHLWTKIRYAGIRAKTATNEIADIEPIFDDYERFCDKGWDIEAQGQKLIRAGSQVHDFLNRTGDFKNKQTIGNIPKLVKIVSLARHFTEFLSKKEANVPVLHFVTGGCCIDDIWSIHKHLMEIGYRGDLTALHFMMDIGFQVIKPDIVISKIFLDLGWLHKINRELPNDLTFSDLQGKGKYGQRYVYTKENMYKPTIELARQIVSSTSQEDLRDDIGWVTKNPIREFDIFLVKYGQKPEREFGIERTLYDLGLKNEKIPVSCGAKSYS